MVFASEVEFRERSCLEIGWKQTFHRIKEIVEVTNALRFYFTLTNLSNLDNVR